MSIRRCIMRTCTFVLFLALAATAVGQVTVTGTTPANNATGVSTNATISISFSAAIDTTQVFDSDQSFLTNLGTPTSKSWSADRRTFSMAVTLQPGTVYFLLLHSVRPAGGGYLQTPYVFYFTTGSSFPSNLYTVSGTITSGSTGISPANAIIVLCATPFSGNSPNAFTGAVADGAGGFTMPYVPAGTWYHIAAKDADQDGSIEPSKGDPLAFGDSVTVTNANVTGVIVPFKTFTSVRYMDVRDPLLSLAATLLPANRELRMVSAWRMDSLGRSEDWEFVYTIPGAPRPRMLRGSAFGVAEDTSGNWDGIYYSKPFTNLLSAALPDSVIARAERTGGAAFRAQPKPDPNAEFVVSLRGGDLHNSEFFWLVSDTSKNYWGASYRWRIQISQQRDTTIRQMLFLADFATGQIIGTLGVTERQTKEVPGQYSLAQNYPNPFNPSTSISFGLPSRSRVKLEVFNLIGQRVASLVNEERNAGMYEVTWTPAIPSGVYLYRIEAVGSDAPSQKFFQVRKMVLVK
jgi:methionine-rich copper-binding protein CopC